MAKQSINNIDKILSSGGPNETPLDMKQFITMADQEKIRQNTENNLIEAIQEKYLNNRRPGETLDEYLRRTPVEELRRIELKDGSIVDLDKYRKDKKPVKIKQLNLSSVLGADTPVSSLSEKDKETVLMLLKMSGIGSKE